MLVLEAAGVRGESRAMNQSGGTLKQATAVLAPEFIGHSQVGASMYKQSNCDVVAVIRTTNRTYLTQINRSMLREHAFCRDSDKSCIFWSRRHGCCTGWRKEERQTIAQSHSGVILVFAAVEHHADDCKESL